MLISTQRIKSEACPIGPSSWLGVSLGVSSDRIRYEGFAFFYISITTIFGPEPHRRVRPYLFIPRRDPARCPRGCSDAFYGKLALDSGVLRRRRRRLTRTMPDIVGLRLKLSFLSCSRGCSVVVTCQGKVVGLSWMLGFALVRLMWVWVRC